MPVRVDRRGGADLVQAGNLLGGHPPGRSLKIVHKLGLAARPDQEVIVTDLAGLGAAAEKSPTLSLIVIGKNVRLRQELDWLVRTAAV